ncbi:MAG: hypothetical protein C5B51_04885 [Terriglobia bacterium]|nr:MAG: hypothetical protein C5B51_04885 [Terriglobia bacterium]
MANQATYDDANLILRLYELRREETLRKARQWFMTFSATSLEEVQKAAPQGSQENAYMRMVTSYWDMAATFVTSGVLNEELFLETNGEALFIWEKIRPLVPAIREAFQSPGYMSNLEKVANVAIKRMGADAYESFSARVRGMAAAKQGS